MQKEEISTWWERLHLSCDIITRSHPYMQILPIIHSVPPMIVPAAIDLIDGVFAGQPVTKPGFELRE